MAKKLFILTAVLLLAFPVFTFADYGVQIKTSGCIANQVLPDSGCTPGAVLTTNTKTVCVSGYTKTVRNVPLVAKKKVFAEYGVSYSLHSNYEVDHLISLELGGSNDISNLWPESSLISNGSSIKDKFENYLHAQVCGGKLSLVEAQAEISGNWFKYYSATTPNTKTPSKSSIPSTSSKPPVSSKSPASPSPSQPSSLIPSVPSTPTTPSPTPQFDTVQTNRPVGATALCRDGSYSFSQSRRGTCSHHGGVAQWY